MKEQLSLGNLVGNSLDVYRLEEMVEHQESGAIYIARSGTSNVRYRLRIISPLAEFTPESRMVFLGLFQQRVRELMLLLTAGKNEPKHPHLLPVVNSGNTPEYVYLLSPYTPMLTLTEQLQKHGAMDILTVGFYLDQIARALEYAHQYAILHRDLTTDVVYIRNDGRLVIADLGVMHILELGSEDKKRALLFGNSSMSAPAPEQLRGQPVHTYTDVYALGAMLYSLLTGQPVFQGETREKQVTQHLQSPVPSLAKWRRIIVHQRDVTPALDKLIASAMAKDPLKRIQHPADLANYYHQIIAPNDMTRVPVDSPHAAEIAAASAAAPIIATSSLINGGSSQRISPRKAIARRRAIVLIGGGALAAVGALAFTVGEKWNAYTSTNTGSTLTTGITSNGGQNLNSTPTNPPATDTASTPGATASNPTATPSGNVIARTSDVPLNSAINFNYPSSIQAGVLVHLDNNKFVAFDSACTHRSSCAVSYVPQDKMLECPCHGAVFDPANNGAALQGPTNRALAAIQITVNSDGTITTN